MADIFERFYGDTTSEPEEKSPDPSFRQLPRLDPQNGSSEQEQKSKRFTWLIPLIAMIPVLISIVPEALEKSAPVMRHFLHQHIEDEFSNFEYVMVVAAARDIDPGAIITKEDIRVIIVRREAVPANAVSPLDIDLVIGKRTKNTMQKGDILLLKSMTDDE